MNGWIPEYEAAYIPCQGVLMKILGLLKHSLTTFFLSIRRFCLKTSAIHVIKVRVMIKVVFRVVTP
jgi:hypothetical protein